MARKKRINYDDMADIEKLKPLILKWEGGYSNHPADKGGATNKGVTIATYRHYFGRGRTVNDLKKMTDEEWTTILRRGYWNPWHGDEIASQDVANMCVDWAWASGTGTSIRKVQAVVGVTVDGVCGAVTLAALNAADPSNLLKRIRAARLAYVEAIVKNNPSQRVFLKGWKRRINAIVCMLLMMVVYGCATKRPVAMKDSVRVEYRERISYVRDTLYIKIPLQEREQTVRDSVSRLENDFSESDARINADGTLYHSLATKGGTVGVEATAKVIMRDSIVYVGREVKVPVMVEKQLSAWQKFRLRWFGVLVAVLLALLLWTFRKPILVWIRKII